VSTIFSAKDIGPAKTNYKVFFEETKMKYITVNTVIVEAQDMP